MSSKQKESTNKPDTAPQNGSGEKKLRRNRKSVEGLIYSICYIWWLEMKNTIKDEACSSSSYSCRWATRCSTRGFTTTRWCATFQWLSLTFRKPPPHASSSECSTLRPTYVPHASATVCQRRKNSSPHKRLTASSIYQKTSNARSSVANKPTSASIAT